jgi:hypothetical protein
MLNDKTNRRDHKLIVQQSPGNLMETTLKHATVDLNVPVLLWEILIMVTANSLSCQNEAFPFMQSSRQITGRGRVLTNKIENSVIFM